MATKYEGLTSAQWANRIVEYNPGKLDKSALVKHYTAQQLGKFQDGGNTQLTKALKGKSTVTPKTPKKSSDEDAVEVDRYAGRDPALRTHLRLRSSFARSHMRTASRSTSTRRRPARRRSSAR